MQSASVPKYPLAPVPQRLPPRDPQPTGLAAAAGLGTTEVRVCLAFHNCLDCGTCYAGIRTSVINAISGFLGASGHHQVGICSYIGWSGKNSRQKRLDLERAVVHLNQQLVNRGVPLNQFCHLFITSESSKWPISSMTCHTHLDDKVSVIRSVESRGVEGAHYYRGDVSTAWTTSCATHLLGWCHGSLLRLGGGYCLIILLIARSVVQNAVWHFEFIKFLKFQ